GVLIAVGGAEGPEFGIIDQPYTQERFWGGLGEARWRGPHGGGALGTRATRDLSDSVLFTTFPEIGSADERAAFGRVAGRAKLVRYGMDCYAYALLAAGQIDLVIEAGLQAYDIHAPLAVVEAAGGIVTDWQGGPAREGGQVIAAANRDLHAQALALLAAE
ncbi:inositol monophosphatase family protein, partial [Citreimonas sp.]|uniref:inositol monophosphatase family protein n=1 Tax=Citreimonas sp. TaxID=3036715 RepID=UPI00405832A5